jgi:hypothetical protein
MYTRTDTVKLSSIRCRIGDLRLQALCSYATFEDHLLAKRCLYLFAGMPFNDEGLLAACAYEYPTPHFGGNSIGEPGGGNGFEPFS